MKILKLVRCRLLDRHDATKLTEKGMKNYRILLGGDYGDMYGCCKDCNKLVHGDFHMYGDAIWRRYSNGTR